MPAVNSPPIRVVNSPATRARARAQIVSASEQAYIQIRDALIVCEGAFDEAQNTLKGSLRKKRGDERPEPIGTFSLKLKPPLTPYDVF